MKNKRERECNLIYNMINPSECLQSIKDEIKKLKASCTADILCNNIIKKIFIKEMGYSCRTTEPVPQKKYTGVSIENRLLILASENTRTKALQDITYELRGTFEWGILFHKEGIWLLNRDINVKSDDVFRKDKIVLEILFGKNTDSKYFKYFSYDNLLGNDMNAYFFRDIITYKNMTHKGASGGWIQYHTALKRFLDFYVENVSDYSRYTDSSYDYINLTHFISYLRDGIEIQSLSTVKNAFFFVKKFMISKTNNGEFNISSKKITEKFSGLQERLMKDEELDINKLARVLCFLKKGKNHIRNEALFLWLLSFGTERRNICVLEWDKDIINVANGKLKLNLNGKFFPLPKTLSVSLKKLKEQHPAARYIFGSDITEYKKPLKEDAINSIFSGIVNIDEQDSFYRQFTPTNIRRWLVKYLLEDGYPLQEIMKLMNITITNLGNYLNDDEVRASVVNKHMNKEVHPMENFLKMVEEGCLNVRDR